MLEIHTCGSRLAVLGWQYHIQLATDRYWVGS
jgi:hypothetical protein